MLLKRLLLSGAALTVTATFAVAQAPAPSNEPGAAAPMQQTAPTAAPATSVDPAAQAELKTDPNLYTNLKGASIIGENDEAIGSVADLLISPNGELKALVIGHGGLVGIGQTYRNYEVSALPEVADGKVKISSLNTAALEGVPEYSYPEANSGRASTDANAPAAGADSAPSATPAPQSASASPPSDLWPASYIVGATISNAQDKAAISDLRFEGNKVAAAIIDKGSLGLGNAVTEVKFEDLQISGDPSKPDLTLKSGAAGIATEGAPAQPAQ